MLTFWSLMLWEDDARRGLRWKANVAAASRQPEASVVAPDRHVLPLASKMPMPEIASLSGAVCVQRNGEVDALAFPQAVKAIGRRTLIIAGVGTSVCVAFPALAALPIGYKVYAVIDASGDVGPAVAQATTACRAQAGVIPTTTNAASPSSRKPGAVPRPWTSLASTVRPRRGSPRKSDSVQSHAKTGNGVILLQAAKSRTIRPSI